MILWLDLFILFFFLLTHPTASGNPIVTYKRPWLIPFGGQSVFESAKHLSEAVDHDVFRWLFFFNSAAVSFREEFSVNKKLIRSVFSTRTVVLTPDCYWWPWILNAEFYNWSCWWCFMHTVCRWNRERKIKFFLSKTWWVFAVKVFKNLSFKFTFQTIKKPVYVQKLHFKCLALMI